MAVQIGLIDTIYNKALRMSLAAKGERGIGTIVNLQSNDAQKLWALPEYLHTVWSGEFRARA